MSTSQEQQAYEAMISLFYGKVFGLVKPSIIEEVQKTFNETGVEFDTHCVKEEGWNNIEQVYEFAEMIKGMSKKQQAKFMVHCPSPLLRKFIKNELK
jgi:hypothetical protein